MSTQNQTISLRPARLEDRAFLLRLYASTRERELAQVPFTAEQRATFLEQQFSAQARYYEQQYRDASFDVVEVGGEPAGRLTVARAGAEILIVDVALMPQFRGRGLGTRLLAPVLAEADARGVRTSIHVERLNPSQRLYRRLGFAPAEEEPGGVYLRFERPPGGHAPQANTVS
jgi:ribosomal protein S18 acetylase RimI-like enzyme